MVDQVGGDVEGEDEIHWVEGLGGGGTEGKEEDGKEEDTRLHGGDDLIFLILFLYF